MTGTYVVITPAKNEAALIANTIRSLTGQTRLPGRWIIVDDASTDRTAAIAVCASQQHPWIRVITRQGDATRRVGSATVHAMQGALPMLAAVNYDFLCVVDADIILPPQYFEVLLRHFAEDARLGIASGRVFDRRSDGRLVRMRELPEMTSGAIKCWRRTCFEAIGGLVTHPSWDAIDCYKAMMLGWRTKSFDDLALKVIHLRPTGSSYKSVYHGLLRRGRSMRFMGSHPLWALASAVYHSVDRPYVVGGLCTVAGYTSSMLAGHPRLEDRELIQYIRQRQWRQLKMHLFGGHSAGA